MTPLVQLKEPLKANVYVGPILLGHSATNVTKDTKAALVINVNLDTILMTKIHVNMAIVKVLVHKYGKKVVLVYAIQDILDHNVTFVIMDFTWFQIPALLENAILLELHWLRKMEHANV